MSRSVQAPWAWSAARWMVGALAVAAAVQALLCALGGDGPGVAQAASASTHRTPSSDPLQAQAPQSSRAAQSVLLAISRAGDRLVAVGERGVILTSDDSGQHWQQAHVPVSVTLTAVHFATPQLGWAVGHGGVVLHSSDGGRQWLRQLDGTAAAQAELAAARLAAQASDDDTSKRRLREAERALEDGANQPWLDVRFWSPTEGMVVGAYGAILRTRDGGRSWQSLRGHLANPKGRHLYSLQFGGGKLYVVGEQGSIYVSRDRGEQFEALSTPYRGTFFGLQAQGDTLLAYGLRGNVWRSTDAGQTWQPVPTGQATTVTAGTTRPDGRMVLVDESGRVLQTALGASQGEALQPLRVPQPFAYTGVVTAADGSLVLTGVRGTTRIPPEQPLASAQP